jgi:DNA-binding response OmpR family regulator
MNNPLHLLLADSDQRCLEAFRAYFEQTGWQCDLAPDIQALLNAASNRTYDLVITDAAMPGIDTLDFLKSLKKEKPSQAVIVVTGECSVADAVNYMKEGAVDFIQKPVDLVFLEQSIRSALTSLRQSEVDQGIYNFVTVDCVRYEMTSAQAASIRMPLVLADRLHRVGRISQNTKLEMTLAFQEALANSLDHGNLELKSEWKEVLDEDYIDKYSIVKRERLQDPKYASRKLVIETSYDQQHFMITIKDEGAGFLVGNEKVIKKNTESLCAYGRGMAIMFVSMDEVIYSERGTQIKLVKRLKD